MGFLDSLVSVGKSAIGFLKGNSIGAQIAKTAGLAFLVNKLSSSVTKSNDQQSRDPGVRVLTPPNTEKSIPIVYGQAWLSGIVTDAILADNNTTMWFCLTLSEKTGTLLSDSSTSVISFDKVLIENAEVQFQSDGVTVNTLIDPNGETITDFQGLVKFYPFSGNSASPVKFDNNASGNTQHASGLFPSWTTSNAMTDLVFCLVRVTYNKDKNLTNLPDIKFRLSNTMSMPGDVIYDYMTDTRYGAGIPASEIYSS